MRGLEVVLTRAVAGLAAGLLLNCGGGSYGGGGSNPPATLQISVEPETITLGESATVSWSSNARNCQASGAWSGQKTSTGSETVTPTATGSFTYSLVCSGGGYGESEMGSATLTVNAAAAAGAFVGEACCEGAEAFAVAGLANEAGEMRLLASGAHIVREAGRGPVAYAGCDDCLAGGRLAKAPSYRLLRIVSPPAPQAAESGRLPGSYTTFLGNGYTLTVTIDAAGALTGADTRGCSLDGTVKAIAGSNLVEVQHTVTGCGARDGRYAGLAALLPAEAGRPASLLLSTSNAEAAIGWRLDR